MTLCDELIERIKTLEDQHKQAVKSVHESEVELSVKKSQKKLLAKQITACKADLEKLQGSVQ